LYRRAGNGLSATCALLAAAPDLDLLFTTHRTYTHSIGAVIVVGLFAALTSVARRREGPSHATRIALMCAAAYASHLLLDWLGVDLYPPLGLQALWPFDSGWYISGLDLFPQTRREHLLTWPVLEQNFFAVVQEAAILVPIVVALWLVREKALAGLAPEETRRHHPPE
jgi:membrane-bound metal-dependent hydrolase YbcI (DUF457 family)